MHTLPFSQGGFPSWECPGAPGSPRGSAAAEPRGAEGRAGQAVGRQPGLASACQWVGAVLSGFKGFFFFFSFFHLDGGCFFFRFSAGLGFVFFPFHSQQVLQQKTGIKSMRGRSVCPGILIFSFFFPKDKES